MNNLVSYAKSANAIISLSGEQESNRAVSTELVSSHLDYVTAAALQILLQDNIFNNIQTRNDVLWGFPVFLNVVEDNITAMLLNIYGKLLGFYPFEANKTGSDLAATFSDGSARKNLTLKCVVGTNGFKGCTIAETPTAVKFTPANWG